MSMRFEWDPKKAASNLIKHGVTFAEALTVFADPLACIFDDNDHSAREPREIIDGHSARGRLLCICFTERAASVRIIGARKTTRMERLDYEENHR